MKGEVEELGRTQNRERPSFPHMSLISKKAQKLTLQPRIKAWVPHVLPISDFTIRYTQ
ncbi:unnamed protein product [Meloidogyne enterolobii]|uniref:Uncharacterized protein n=1 Tax=Meloidogyne enterolobii TaxID=390850 RepID=A0ACB0ZL59_MELEN